MNTVIRLMILAMRNKITKLGARERWVYSTESPRDMMLQLVSMGAGPAYETGNSESLEGGRNVLDFIPTLNAYSDLNDDDDDDDDDIDGEI